MKNMHKVLVVDDNMTSCLFVSRSLGGVGYQVLHAVNGQEGIEKALQEMPHCILLDIVLPDISGFEVCRRLRTRDPHHRHPIILISHKNTPVDHKWGLKQGADYYLAKPFTPEALEGAVQYVLSPGFRPPASIEQLITGNSSSTAAQAGQVDWSILIPVRRKEELAQPLQDKTVRRLYDAIDNRKNVGALSSTIGLPQKDVYKLLQSLLANDYIQLYGPDRKLIDKNLLPGA